MTKALAILAAALAFASALADGFVYTPAEPSPERLAALGALCGRLESKGLPRLPRGAAWVEAWDDEMPWERKAAEVFFGDFEESNPGSAWRLPSGDSNGTNDLVGLSGHRFASSAEEVIPARIARDVPRLIAALRKTHGGGSCGLALIFASGLFRTGHEADADAVLGAIEAACGLDAAERDAVQFLSRSDIALEDVPLIERSSSLLDEAVGKMEREIREFQDKAIGKDTAGTDGDSGKLPAATKGEP